MIPIAPGFFHYHDQTVVLGEDYVVFSAFTGNSSIGTQTIEGYNYKDDTASGFWKPQYDYSNANNLMLYRYTDESVTESTNSAPFVSNAFDSSRTYKLTAFTRSGSSDVANSEIEFLDVNSNTVAAIKISPTETPDSFSLKLEYGANLSSLSAAPTAGSGTGVVVWGYLTFDSTTMYFADAGQMGTTPRITTWSFACDVTSIVKIRVKSLSASSATSGTSWAATRLATVTL